MQPTPLEPEPVQVFFDYTCPFTYRAQRWLDTLTGVDLRWRPFSLLERNYRGDGRSVWRLPERADDISLLLFAGHELVRSRSGDLTAYRQAVFARWHQGDTRLDLDSIVRLAAEAGAPATPDDVRTHFLDAETEHAAAAEVGVFGTPTLVYPEGTVAFLKLAAVPTPERAERLWELTRALAREPVELREWQQVRPAPGVHR